MRMPVRMGAVHLQARNNPHSEVALTVQRTNGGGDGADGGDRGSTRATAWGW